jgi:hypothetical protein
VKLSLAIAAFALVLQNIVDKIMNDANPSMFGIGFYGKSLS